MSDWDVDVDGSTDIHPGKGTYLITIIDGEDTKKDAQGHEAPRKSQDGCPMIMFKCAIVMDQKGDVTWKKYPFSIFVTRDDRGMRIMRRMIKTLLPDMKGKVSISPKVFNDKMAWIELDRRGDFTNANHESWQPRDAIKVSAGATTASAGGSGQDDDDSALPF